MADRELKEDWLHAIAHDLRGPIGAVRGALELIVELGPLNERQQHFAVRAMAGLERMGHLIELMLDMAWVDGSMELYVDRCDMTAIIENTARILENVATERGVAVHMQIADDLAPVEGDAGRLAQVVDNLLTNAIKYNRDNGSIWVTAVNAGDAVEVTVRDTGVGISPEEQPRIFDPFFRTDDSDKRKIKGTGLGLAITKAIIERHNGHIRVESQPDEGTSFIFTIPCRFPDGDGRDEFVERAATNANLESSETAGVRFVEGAGEEIDPVDDDQQEGQDRVGVDASRDDLADELSAPSD